MLLLVAGVLLQLTRADQSLSATASVSIDNTKATKKRLGTSLLCVGASQWPRAHALLVCRTALPQRQSMAFYPSHRPCTHWSMAARQPREVRHVVRPRIALWQPRCVQHAATPRNSCSTDGQPRVAMAVPVDPVRPTVPKPLFRRALRRQRGRHRHRPRQTRPSAEGTRRS